MQAARNDDKISKTKEMLLKRANDATGQPLHLLLDAPQLADIIIRALKHGLRNYAGGWAGDEETIYAASLASVFDTSEPIRHLLSGVLDVDQTNTVVEMVKRLAGIDGGDTYGVVDEMDYAVVHDAYHLSMLGRTSRPNAVFKTQLGKVLAQLKRDMEAVGISRTLLEELTWAYLPTRQPREQAPTSTGETMPGEVPLPLGCVSPHQRNDSEGCFFMRRGDALERLRQLGTQSDDLKDEDGSVLVLALVDLSHPHVWPHIVWSTNTQGQLVVYLYLCDCGGGSLAEGAQCGLSQANCCYVVETFPSLSELAGSANR